MKIPTPTEYRNAVWRSDLPPTARYVALHLLDRAAPRGEGHCWPSQQTVARCLGLAVPTVKRAMRTLRGAGWLVDTGDRRGSTGRVVVHRLAIPMGSQRPPNGITEIPSMGSQRSLEEIKEEIKEELLSTGPVDVMEDSMEETQTSLFGTQPSGEEVAEAQEPTQATEDGPTTTPGKPPRPYRSAAEQDAWRRCVDLWRKLASGTLRKYRTADPARGGGKLLLRALRYMPAAEVERAILWMTCSPESQYLRESDTPRGWDTLWHQRDQYPENADDWLERDWRGRKAAMDHGVPLPEGMAPADQVPGVVVMPSPEELAERAKKERLRARLRSHRQWGIKLSRQEAEDLRAYGVEIDESGIRDAAVPRG